MCFIIIILVPGLGPSNFTANYDRLRPTSVQFSWEEVPIASQNGIIRGYTLIVEQLETNSENIIDTDVTMLEANTFSHEVTSLIHNTVYNISLAARTSSGVGPVSSIQVFILPEGK